MWQTKTKGHIVASTMCLLLDNANVLKISYSNTAFVLFTHRQTYGVFLVILNAVNHSVPGATTGSEPSWFTIRSWKQVFPLQCMVTVLKQFSSFFFFPSTGIYQEITKFQIWWVSTKRFNIWSSPPFLFSSRFYLSSVTVTVSWLLWDKLTV